VRRRKGGEREREREIRNETESNRKALLGFLDGGVGWDGEEGGMWEVRGGK
jgi:hypothetical protein